MPSPVARSQSNKRPNKRPNRKPNRRPNRGRAAKNSAPRLRLWIGLAVVCGLGLIAFVLLLRLLLPVLLLMSLGALGYGIWRTVHRHRQQQRRRQARLNTQFYQLLKRQQGRISALDFAMFTQTDGIAAQSYLNEQAQAFSAYCETTIQGDIVYVFSLATVDQPTHRETAQAAWAEQARVQRAHFERKRAAWISAKQMRSLRQLSQKAVTKQPVIPLPAPPDEYRDLEKDARSPMQPKQIKLTSLIQTHSAQAASTKGPTEEPTTKGQKGQTEEPKKEPKRQSAQLPLSTPKRQTLRHDREVVTIDVSAVRS